jgi:hypothetical protein
VLKLIDMLEDLDDVQNVYSNAEIPTRSWNSWADFVAGGCRAGSGSAVSGTSRFRACPRSVRKYP